MNKSKGRDLSALIKKKEESTKANDASIQGEITSVLFRAGPIEERQTKDISAAIPFFILLFFSVYLFVIAIKDGDLQKLFSGYNKNGEPCGYYDPKLKFIYFPDTKDLKSGVCLSECPKKDTTQLNCQGLTDCLNLNIYDSVPYLDIVCLPTDLDARKNIKEDIKLTIYEFVELNLKSNVLIYLVALLASIFLGILFSISMLYFPKFLSYSLIFLIISIILIFASFFMVLYASPELILREVSGVSAENLIFMTDEVKLTISIILFVVALFSCLLIYLNRIEIKIGINMFKVTAFFLKQVWFSLFLPLIFTLLFLGYIAFTFFVVLSLISIDPYDPNLSSPFGKISPSIYTYIKIAIFLFQTLWVLSFIAHSFYFLLNSGIIYWYFSDDKVADAKEKEKTKDEPSFWAKCCHCCKKDTNPLPEEQKPVETVGKSKLKGLKDKQVEESAEVPIEPENSTSCFCITSKSISKPSNIFLKKGLNLFFPTHMFSIIISSLLIMIFGIFNSTFGYIYNKLARIRDNTVNGCLEKFLKAALCCCFCYDKVFRFISQDGYFSMVIQGTDYFTSSKDVFFLRVRGDEYNTKGDGAGNFVLFLAKSFIILTTLLGIFSFMMDYGYEMEDIFRTTIISFFIAFVGAWLYTSMFYVLNNALLLCYLMDKEVEVNHYGRDKPYSAPNCLADFMLNVYINWYQDHEE